ncbi:probable E3 ubiquitin-protein ligase XERICO [Phragmites australis]|uniref:probable E3 ubiquitin-protein ligase XERICO n=1 Tax=Phragmites australis TaxID=29695 RepID=UPI002D79F56C|nr:probable E3 ubiquitin-protein ligase XERICO [Phragmites australis]
MGISSMPAPKDSLLAYVLYNAAVSIAILADLVRSALVFLGLAVPHAWEDGSEEHQLAAIAAAAAAAGPSLADRFRSRFRPSRFGRRRGGVDCRVCLARFEPESVVNRLPCGHLFHRACLETWLDYDHATCPLCRLRLLPAADDSPSPTPRLARI